MPRAIHLPRRAAIAGLLALALGWALSLGPAGAGQAANTAADAAGFVADLGKRAEAVLAGPAASSEERAAAVRALLLDTVDVERVGQIVLGKYARIATAGQQSEYGRLFQAYLLATYGARLDQYAGERLEVAKARLVDGGRAIVNSVVVRREGPPAKLDWQLLWEDGRWKVVDLVVEGVSLALTQRSEFAAVIKAGGGQVEALLARLREITPTMTAAAEKGLNASN